MQPSPRRPGRLRRPRRVAGIVAGLTAVGGLAVVPAFHAAAVEPDRAATSLAIRAVKEAIRPGGASTVAGALAVGGSGTAAAGRTVTLEARPTGTEEFTPVGTTTARDHGGLRERVMPEVTTLYRWHYAGDTDARPGTSGVVRIRVRTPEHPPRRIPTSLSIRAVHPATTPDGGDLVRGRLVAGRRVPLPHRQVLLVSRTADAEGWVFEGAEKTRKHGVVRFPVEPSEATAYRLVFLGTPLLQPARSGVVRVVTRPDLTLSADPQRLDRGQTTALSGTATHEGDPVAGATVKLFGRTAGAADRHLVGTATTATDGSVSFTDAPERTTVYRLRLVRGDGVPGAVSNAARVVVRIPSSLSIRGRAHDDVEKISGQLRGGGHPLAHRTVALLAQAPGAADWTEVGTARTGERGVVRFTQPLVPGTGYRLAYAGGPRFAPITSGTLVS